MADTAAPPIPFAERNRNLLFGLLSVALFLAAWQAVFLFVPFNPLFISKPSLIAVSFYDMVMNGDLFHDLAVSAVPFLYGFSAAVVVGVAVGIVMGWRARVGYALDPLMTVFYASPLVALAPLVIVFFGVGVSGKAIIIFLLSVFPFIFNAQAGVRAVDRLLINVVRSLGGSEKDLYLKVIVPSVLPYIVAGARIAIGRGLIGVLVAQLGITVDAVVVSPDSLNVYVRSQDRLLALDRSLTTGALTIKPGAAGCFTEALTPSCTDSVGLLADGYELALSPTGSHLYVSNVHGVAVFARGPEAP